MRFCTLVLVFFCLSLAQALMAKGCDNFKVTRELLHWLQKQQELLLEGFQNKISGHELDFTIFLKNKTFIRQI